jgi:hypothetical protein
MLKDYDPYDYAKAVRVFQKSEKTHIQFQLYIEKNPEILAMEIVSAKGARCIQTELDTQGSFRAKNGQDSLSAIAAPDQDSWIQMDILIDAAKSRYSIQLDGETIAEDFDFAAEGIPERIVFRTGRYRLTDNVQKWKSGDKYVPGWDEPNPDEYAPEACYYLKDFKIWE